MIDHWNGFDLGLNARLAHGIIFQGGISTGKQITDNCDIVDPANAGRFGDRSPLVELLAAPPLPDVPHVVAELPCRAGDADPARRSWARTRCPKIDVQIGATFQSIPGIEYGANYPELNSDIARPTTEGGLGRLPFGQSVADRADDARDPAAGGVLRRSSESAGPATWKGPAHGTDAGRRQSGYVQHLQREHAHQCQQYLFIDAGLPCPTSSRPG